MDNIECNNLESHKNTRRKDLTGQHFGEWTVLEYSGNSKYKCKCSCGVIKDVHAYTLTSGKSTSCGHSSKNKFTDYTGHIINDMQIIGYDKTKRKWKYICICGNIEYESSYNINKYGLKCKSYNTFKDITNKRFGEWTVIKYSGNKLWECKCSCGNTRLVDGTSLRLGKTLSCGHNNKKFIDISGMQFGKLKVLGYKKPYWKCQCDCGRIKYVLSHNLRNNSTLSCGCSRELFDKEELINIILELQSKLNEKPFIVDIACNLNLHEGTIRKYINKYNLHDYINKSYRSRYEKEIANMVKGAKLTVRDVISPYELDIYIPDKKLAIEFNGNYWHSDIFKDRYYHQNKTIECAKKGIQLIHIFEYEWIDSVKHKILTSYIHSKVYSDNKVIGARKTKIAEISNREANEFLNNNHLNGGYNSTINIALYYDNDIVSILALSKPRFSKEYEYEITRYCNRQGISIVGGLEKLFKYFIKKYNPKTVMTYSDLAKFSGKCYFKIGFKVCKNCVTTPGYIWVKPGYNDVVSRYQINKTFKEKYKEYGDTEEEIMSNIGYVKIYNSGNLKLEWGRDNK